VAEGLEQSNLRRKNRARSLQRERPKAESPKKMNRGHVLSCIERRDSSSVPPRALRGCLLPRNCVRARARPAYVEPRRLGSSDPVTRNQLSFQCPREPIFLFRYSTL